MMTTAVQDSLKRIHTAGVTTLQAWIMIQLRDVPSAPQYEIDKLLDRRSSCKTLQNLRDKGMTQQRENKEWELTQKGLKLAKTF